METKAQTTAWFVAGSGDARLDHQHETLVHLVETLAEVVGGSDRRDLAIGLCDVLEEKLLRHFQFEEELMGWASSRPETPAQPAHKALLSRFSSAKRAVSMGDLPEAMSAFNRFRLDMAEHDREVDAPALQRRTGSSSVLTAATLSRIPLRAGTRTTHAHKLPEAWERPAATRFRPPSWPAPANAAEAEESAEAEDRASPSGGMPIHDG